MRARRKTDKAVFVSGSVHLDLLSEVTGHSATVDKIGSLSIEVGGTAYNVAMNLLSFGRISLFFHTALKRSPVTSILVDALTGVNATPLIEYSDFLPQSGFSGHLLDGELTSAVSSIAIESYVCMQTESLREALSRARFAVIDCNHHLDSINMLAGLCTEMGVPFAVCGVSAGKALKITEIKQPPSFIFLNSSELRYIKSRTPAWWAPKETTMIVTDGPLGANVYAGRRMVHHVEAPEVVDRQGTFLGAGDAFCAGFLYALYVLGTGLEEALCNGSHAAAEVIRMPNCSVGQPNLLNRHMHTLQDQAERDYLTGLHRRESGRKFLTGQLERAKVVREKLSILFIDLDHFKAVNDAFGHQTGDLVLQFAARTIASALRDSDMVVRWGGEEFVAILPGCSLEEAERSARRILEKLRAVSAPEIGRPVTASIGVAEARKDEDADRLLARGDRMVYLAKESGRNCVRVWDSSEKEKVPEDMGSKVLWA